MMNPERTFGRERKRQRPRKALPHENHTPVQPGYIDGLEAGLRQSSLSMPHRAGKLLFGRCGFSFVDAGFQALCAALAAAIKFFLPVNFLVGHSASPQKTRATRADWLHPQKYIRNRPICPA